MYYLIIFAMCFTIKQSIFNCDWNVLFLISLNLQLWSYYLWTYSDNELVLSWTSHTNLRQYHLTGFSWEQQYYYDKCLPQGCSSSCKIFEAVSTSLKWIMNHKLGTANIVKVLDDFLFVAESEQECAYALRKFIFLCEELGIPLAMNKTTGPTQILTFLGIELDTLLMTARLPADKLQKYRNTIISLMAQSKVTLRELKSIIGMLQFATTVVTPGRPFLRRLYDLTIHANKPHYYIRLNKQTKDDLLMWISFLHTYNGKTLIYSPTIADSSTVHFYSDACKSAFGATYGSYWIQGKWPTDWQREDITVLELYPIFLAINIFKLKLTNAHIVFHCDNTAVVTIINKQTRVSAPNTKGSCTLSDQWYWHSWHTMWLSKHNTYQVSKIDYVIPFLAYGLQPRCCDTMACKGSQLTFQNT